MEHYLRFGNGRKALACCAAALLGALGVLGESSKMPPDGPVDAYFGDVRKRLLDITPEAKALLDRLAEKARPIVRLRGVRTCSSARS